MCFIQKFVFLNPIKVEYRKKNTMYAENRFDLRLEKKLGYEIMKNGFIIFALGVHYIIRNTIYSY